VRQLNVQGPSFRSLLLGSLSGAVLTIAAPAQAADARPIDLPAGTLDAALAALAAQTGEQLIFTPELVAGRRVPAVSGRLTVDAALARLLAGSDIEIARAGPRIVVLKRRAPAPPAKLQPASDAAPAPGRPFGAGPAAADAPAPAGAAPAAPAAAPTVLQEVRVTGSHIRGGSPAAPVLVVDRAALERSGQATIAGALQALPENFGGESNETTAGVIGADRLSSNAGYGTGVNLRGLGSDSTLVLVNGRRLAGAGNRGDFADLSNIPAIAVERVEVLLDGASALYGSDAVGGVVNVILRRDLDGGEVRLRAGGARGGAEEGLAGVVFGHTWRTGSVLVAYEGYRRKALIADKRALTASADLRPFGGGDYRDTFSFPGNILRVNPATGAATPFWAIPTGQSGVGLRPSDFRPGTVNLFNQNAGVAVLPDQRRQGAYLAVRQEFGPRLEVSADARYGYRKVKALAFGAISSFRVGPNNPFFVAPDGGASDQIQYAFTGLAGLRPNLAGVESVSASIGADLQLPGDWRANAYGAFAQEITENRQSGGVQSLILAEALGNVADNPATAYSAARDGYFNPFDATGAGNSPATIAAITSGFSDSRYRGRVTSANLEADGSVFRLPGGPVKLAVGGQLRRESFSSAGSNYSSQPVPVPITAFDRDRKVASAFAEVRLPLISDQNARRGVRALELSGAVRAEHYSDFGGTVNPRFGVQWSPVDGLRVRGTYGESFRAPALPELYNRQIYSVVDALVGTERIRTLAKLGGNPDLGPETARSWTLGFEWRPPRLSGLRLEATWFRTVFDNRIDRPLVGAPRTAILTDPVYAPFVQRISPATNPADLAQVTALINSPAYQTAQGVFPATSFGAITQSGYVNTAGLKVRGFDGLADYGRDLGGGRLNLSANGSWLLDYQQALTPTAPFRELVGTATYPARFRGRASAEWTRDPVTVGLAWNHVSPFRGSQGERIDAYDTVDLQARWTPAAAWGRGLSVALSVRNLFDADPPFYDNPAGFGFDATNADILGRVIALQVTRSW
jgi:outer membrane receptor protein involved in Fe transport